MNQNQKLRSLTNERTKYKTDRFTLHQEDPNRWKVSGRDSNGLYRRIRFEAKNLSEAIKKAEDVLKKASPSQSMTVSNPHDFPLVQISDALVRSKINRSWTQHTQERDNQFCDYFLRWIDQQGLSFWHELTLEHMQSYKKTLSDRDMAYDSIRLYFQPIRRTARWVASNWPKHYVNICLDFKVSRRETFNPIYNEENGKPFLPIHRILDFLDWLIRPKKYQRMEVKFQIAAGICLQGLAGLQLQEAYRLTLKKFDPQEGTIIIDGDVKNEFRVRRIPIVSLATKILDRITVSHPQDRFLDAFTTYREYARAIRRELNEWDSLLKMKPKDFRNTLQTEAIDGGWYGYYVQRYVGHAPKTIGERHYHGDEWKRMIPHLKEKVVMPIEEIIRQWNPPMDSPLQTFLL